MIIIDWLFNSLPDKITREVQKYLWEDFLQFHPEIRLATVPEVALWRAVARQNFLPVAPRDNLMLFDYDEEPDIHVVRGLNIGILPEGIQTCLIIEPSGPSTPPLSLEEYDMGNLPAALTLQRKRRGKRIRRLSDLIAQTNLPYIPVWPDVEEYLITTSRRKLVATARRLFT